VSLSPAFLDELRARTPLAALVGRRVKLARSGRNWTGCCPFHNERTPSFYVYDDHYHCFGCGAHGDAVSFAMQTQGLGFPDAVAQLAQEAGLEVPRASPRAAALERQRADAGAALEAAQAGFARRLRTAEGAAGLAYLRGRGLTDETIARFGLGWSGDGRGGLTRELGAAGFEPSLLLEAGLLREGDGGERRELFFNRVTFPIRDRRGRIVSFGGRTLGDGKPKYLNGPETDLFQKRRLLFALDLAREAVRGGAELIVVEGYMDAIALHQAGFTGAVAPLGTALTEEQLEELWRLSPMPVLCFDGDAAGSRAAARAAATALPLLTPERGVRVAALPAGEDPDSLVRAGGGAAVTALVGAARPLSEALYDLLREGVPDTPEGRALFRRRLEDAAGTIADRQLRYEYQNALRDRFFGERRGKTRQRPAVVARPTPTREMAQQERARNLVAILLRHPWLLEREDETFGGLALPPSLARLREAMHAWLDAAETLDSACLLTHLHASGMTAEVTAALANSPMPHPPCARPDAMPAEVEAGWWQLLGLLDHEKLDAEWVAARRALAQDFTLENQHRLIVLGKARAQRSAEIAEDLDV
jgi:DNA primase